jgi:hypothetical protein
MADVCRTDERPIKVYVLDLAIGSENFEPVPLGRYDRRVVADSHYHESGSLGKARADSRN